MENVYKSASAVLVIDSVLELVENTAALASIAIMIASSVWWTRLWTIQEGAFAQKLYFQLKTGAVAPSDLYMRAEEVSEKSEHWNPQYKIVTDVLSRAKNLSLEKVRSNNGREILHSMTWRFTTRSADEAICLSILLGFPTERIKALHQLPEDADMRLRHFMLLQKYLPSSVLFWESESGNMSVDGFRWAP
jgi:hypothetical protein